MKGMSLMDDDARHSLLSIFTELWDDHGPRYEAQQAFWNRRAQSFSDHLTDSRHRRRFEELYAWLKELGALRKASHILDIGCGPGTYAIPFAKLGHHVTGIDIAPEMIARAQDNAAHYGISERTAFQTAVWEELDVAAQGWEQAFDLVFASMTPAIRNAEALYKMLRVCRGGCFLSSFIDRRDPFVQRIRARLGLSSGTPPMNRIYAAFNLLWLNGYFPSIRYIDERWEQSFTVDEAIEHFRHFMRLQLVDEARLDETVEKTVRAIAEEQASNVIRQTVEVKIAWLYWPAKDRSATAGRPFAEAMAGAIPRAGEEEDPDTERSIGARRGR